MFIVYVCYVCVICMCMLLCYLLCVCVVFIMLVTYACLCYKGVVAASAKAHVYNITVVMFGYFQVTFVDVKL